ncbi:MAG: sugar ABC transporter permease [Candidatus Dormibacteraeota bacterium]|nr:sugar ABC transporter permease [Candidatus Dormibacteraeota bacterium]
MQPYLLFAPAILLVATFKLWPFAVGIETSLTRPRNLFDSQFVGLSNYYLAAQDDVWRHSIVNLVRMLATLPIFVLVPLVIASVLFHGIRGWRFFRAVFFLSWLLPPVTVGYMFDPILGFRGPVNTLLTAIHVAPVNWLGSVGLTPWVLVGVILWSWFGLGTGIYLAGFGTLPSDHLDAARIDGAGPISTLLWVEVPHLLPTVSYWSIICTTGMLLGLFPFILALTGGGPGDATTMPEFQVWHVSTSTYNPGYASALGITLFGAAAILTLAQVRLLFSRSREDT